MRRSAYRRELQSRTPPQLSMDLSGRSASPGRPPIPRPLGPSPPATQHPPRRTRRCIRSRQRHGFYAMAHIVPLLAAEPTLEQGQLDHPGTEEPISQAWHSVAHPPLMTVR
jgi:hypothetical protein